MRHMWIVEFRDSNGRFMPAMFGHSELKIYAELEVKKAKRTNPNAKYRIVKYVPTTLTPKPKLTDDVRNGEHR